MNLENVNADLTKKEILSILKQNAVTHIEIDGTEKPIRKCTKQQLIDFANPQIVAETEDSVLVAEVTDVSNDALEIDPPTEEVEATASEEEPTAPEIADLEKLLEEAKEAGKKKKKRGGAKGSWATRIATLISSDTNKKDDGSYFFTIEQAAELMGVEEDLTPFRYSTDWHPSYKGAGRACVQHQFKGRLRISKKQPETTGIYLTPLTPEEAQALMDKYNYNPLS